MKHFEETRNLLENSNFFYIICTGMDGNYSYVNPHYQRKFPQHQQLVGKPYYITMHPDDMQTCAEVAAKCFANPDKVFPATIRKDDGDGGYIFTQWEYKALFTEDGVPDGVFCLGYDITTYEIEKQLGRQRENEIGDKTRKLEEIAFQHSHLIRAPLSNVLGLAQVLAQSDADNNINNLCQLILESATKVDNVIRDIGGIAYNTDPTNEVK
ncbi:MAG TPA: PAS domain-containing protein [Flavobacterium sp.]